MSQGGPEARRAPRRSLPFVVFGLAFLGGVLGPWKNSGLAGASVSHFDASTTVVSLDQRRVFGTGWLVRESRDWLLEEGGQLAVIDDLRRSWIRQRHGRDLKADVTWRFDPFALGVGIVLAAFLAGVSGVWWSWLRAWALQARRRLTPVVAAMALWPALIGLLVCWRLTRGRVQLPTGLALVPPEVALYGTCYLVGCLVTLWLALAWRRRGTVSGTWEEPEVQPEAPV